MKAVLFSAVAGVVVAGSANASIVTIGTGLARSCYEAAHARNPTAANLMTCDRALTQEPLAARDIVATYVNRGILHLVDRNLSVARTDFDRAIELDAGEPEAWLNKSIVMLYEKDSASARTLANRAIELGTRKPELAFYIRGVANEDLGNLREAYADLVRARDLAPEWVVPQQELQRYSVR